jgi:hypothetical protein
MEQGWVVARQTTAGTDEPSGHWVLTIARLNGYDGQGQVRAIEGPWQIGFDVP